MAGIDKTYTDSYELYKEFKEWAEGERVVFYNGHSVCVGDFVFEWGEHDFNGQELPIMNTPTWLDIYLIQNCKVDFVLDRMREVYREEEFESFKAVDLKAAPNGDFQQGRKITVKRSDRSNFPIHNKPYKGGRGGWMLFCTDNFWYCTETKVWSSGDFPYPHNTNVAHIKSLKGVVRHLRKQYLPKGVTFHIAGRYVGEEYLVVIS